MHTVCALANPGSLVTKAAWDKYAAQIIQGVRDHPDCDGVLLGLHGAMVCDYAADAEGQLAAEIREIVGDATPIAVTLDLHANLGDVFFAALAPCGIVCSYVTYPHVDMKRTALVAARLLGRTMSGEIKPYGVLFETQHAAPCPGFWFGVFPTPVCFQSATARNLLFLCSCAYPIVVQ